MIDKKAKNFYLNLRGKSKWAFVHTPDKRFENYRISVALDKDSEKLIKQAGSSLQKKEQDDGLSYYTFRRAHEQKFGDRTQVQGPPKVLDMEGKPFDDFIGDGSEVIVQVEFYHGQRGVGHRLHRIYIVNLVESEFTKKTYGVDVPDPIIPEPSSEPASSIEVAEAPLPPLPPSM